MSHKKDLTKEGVMAAILACKEKLGRVPGVSDLERHTNLYRHDVNRFFGSYADALKECKLEKTGSGIKAELKDLFLDWARVVRKLKRLPKLHEYKFRHGRYSEVPFTRRFGAWSNVPEGMMLYAQQIGLAEEWKDVAEIVKAAPERVRGKSIRGKRAAWESKRMKDRPTYGPLITHTPLAHGPENEGGVLFLFGALAEQLGFQVLKIQTAFPDCEAMREVEPDVWQRVRIEFEYQSRNFLKHLHDKKGCDLIVCWAHNWPDAPLEVIELKTALSGQLNPKS